MNNKKALAKAKEAKENYANCCSCGNTMYGILKISKPLKRVVCVACEIVVDFNGGRKNAS